VNHDYHTAVDNAIDGTDAERVHVEMQAVGYLGSKVHEQAVAVHTGYLQGDGVGEAYAVDGNGGVRVFHYRGGRGVVGIVYANDVVAILAGKAYCLGARTAMQGDVLVLVSLSLVSMNPDSYYLSAWQRFA
jgi:hypothetical protein